MTESTRNGRVRYALEGLILAALSVAVFIPWGCSRSPVAPDGSTTLSTFTLPNGVIAHPGEKRPETETGTGDEFSTIPIVLDPLESEAKLEGVFEESIEAFPRYQNMFKMYFDLMSSGSDKSPANLAQYMETRSAEFFRDVLREGIETGDIRKDLSINHAAYLIDCVYSLFFTTLASKYQRERFRIFTNADISKSKRLVKKHMKQVLGVIEGGIGA